VRKAVAVFLMVFLPLQWGWALAAAYCKHEVSAASQAHFGHHEHSHSDASVSSVATDASAVNEAATGGGDSDGANGSGASISVGDVQPDADCGVCHFGAAQATVPFVEHALAELGADLSAVYEASWPASPLESFFRPPLTARA
jgi:hypothetical protein